MTHKSNKFIPSSKKDDGMLSKVVLDVYDYLQDNYFRLLPDNCDFHLSSNCISYQMIRSAMTSNGIPHNVAEMYYGLESSIVPDSPIIYLSFFDGHTRKLNPLFIGEIKKQGTNDRRLSEGKKKQAIGNAAPDRVAKNYTIAADYCRHANGGFFPYTVFLYGCDFSDDGITNTTKSKLLPFFGSFNTVNPFFDENVKWALKGGSCFYQGERFVERELFDIILSVCREGLRYFFPEKFWHVR